jgi:hypothetical protein
VSFLDQLLRGDLVSGILNDSFTKWMLGVAGTLVAASVVGLIAMNGQVAKLEAEVSTTKTQTISNLATMEANRNTIAERGAIIAEVKTELKEFRGQYNRDQKTLQDTLKEIKQLIK